MSPLLIIGLAALFLLACLARWASKSVPRAIVFVALLCASPYIAMAALGLLMVDNDQQAQHVSPQKARSK